MEARSTALANRSDLELRQAAKTFLHVFVGRSIILSYFNPCQGLAVVPRHPFRGLGRQVLWMALQLDQIVEGVGSIQPAGVNQAHKQVTYLRPVQRSIEQCIFPM